MNSTSRHLPIPTEASFQTLGQDGSKRRGNARTLVLLSALFLALTTLATLPPAVVEHASAAEDWPALRLRPFLPGFDYPVQITHAGDGTNRLFVVEQPGRVRMVKSGVLFPTPFLDIRDRVGFGGERGLLGIAFPPEFETKQYFYVNYTDVDGNTVISRFQVSANPNLADPNSEETLLRVAQPYSNHNGGQLAFGPRDGYLYIGMGDGGSGGDPQNYGQRPNTLLGKILRIDVEGGDEPYAIPPSNPFTQTAGYRGEIWALGLRNPWRFSFDRQTGDLYIGDVGQDVYEEIDFQAADSPGGENYGWRLMEGAHCFNPPNCDPAGLTLPVAEYRHALGCSVTGGYVYRGAEYEQMAGVYFFGDYCQGRIWGLRKRQNAWEMEELLRAPFLISAFGEDESGELYVADYRNGEIHHLVEIRRLWLPTILALAY